MSLDEENLNTIAKLTNLSKLELKHCVLPDPGGLGLLSPLTQLTHLNLDSSNLDGEYFEVGDLKPFSLTYLNLSGNLLSVDQIAPLLPSIQPNLKSLLLKGCVDVTPEAVNVLSVLPLQVLDVRSNDSFFQMGRQPSIDWLQFRELTSLGLSQSLDKFDRSQFPPGLTELKLRLHDHPEIDSCNRFSLAMKDFQSFKLHISGEKNIENFAKLDVQFLSRVHYVKAHYHRGSPSP